MMLHVAHAARHGHQRILVRTVDTDAQKLSSQYEIWLAFGTGKNFPTKWLPVWDQRGH